MSLPIVGIVRVRATEAYRANSTIIDEGLAVLSKVPGALGQWHGLEHQDPDYMYFVNVWETLAHREAFGQDKAVYAQVHDAIRPVFDPTGFAYRYHAQLAVAPFQALDAPATEFAVWRLRESADPERFKDMLQKLHEMVSERLGGDVAAGAWGVSLEDPRVFVAVVGWTSVEAHKTAEREKDIVVHISKMLQLADVGPKHAVLTKYVRG